MGKHIRIAVLGDFEDRRPSHIATNEALQHAADAVASSIDIQWIPTQPLEKELEIQQLHKFSGIWGAPGQPASSAGVINAIRFARENGISYVGT